MRVVSLAGAAPGKQPASGATSGEPAAKKAKKEEEDYTDVLQVSHPAVSPQIIDPNQEIHSFHPAAFIWTVPANCILYNLNKGLASHLNFHTSAMEH